MKRLDHFHRRADAVDHRDPQLLRQFARQIGHAATAEHDRPAAVVLFCFNALFAYFSLSQAAAIFQRQHRQIDSVQRGAVALKPVLMQ
ncbi:hypothetical protein D3C79_969770 [compost metagenome]